MKIIPLDQVRAEILANPAAKAEYKRQAPAFAKAWAAVRGRKPAATRRTRPAGKTRNR